MTTFQHFVMWFVDNAKTIFIVQMVSLGPLLLLGMHLLGDKQYRVNREDRNKEKEASL